jgi:hypothetical protein
VVGALAGTFLDRSRPSRSVLAEPARSRIGQLPDTGKGSGLCRKGVGRSSTGTFPPKARICRATRLPVPDGQPPKRLSAPGPRLARHPILRKLPKEPPGTRPVSGPRAAAPCCRRPEGQPDKAGGNRSFLEDRCISCGPGTRKLPTLQAASPSNRSSRERATPPISGAFTCKKMLARIEGSDNTKLPKELEFLCIVSPELHNLFTSCPQLCPQGGRRGSRRGPDAGPRVD